MSRLESRHSHPSLVSSSLSLSFSFFSLHVRESVQQKKEKKSTGGPDSEFSSFIGFQTTILSQRTMRCHAVLKRHAVELIKLCCIVLVRYCTIATIAISSAV